ncbi:MAG: dTDP-4-dehydrorhamnose 3,5-epimerase [Chitinispirillaceae bacterium]|nr:dTDP-4-dehydrorhamnose 3,5-epimerase [Chitinispirillaceae bacterium]
MEFIATDIDGLMKIQPVVHGDRRGFFLEWYSHAAFEKAGIACRFVQDNHSYSQEAGVLRGLHFQTPPFTQAKLIRVTQGGIFDVAVDLRAKSPTFGRWRGFELSAANFTMLFIPAGFAHGFCTLQPTTHVEYKVDAPYTPQHESGIIWNDPQLAVSWPTAQPVLSPKDAHLPLLRDTPPLFSANRQ